MSAIAIFQQSPKESYNPGRAEKENTAASEK
jgi:hypothetical protein